MTAGLLSMACIGCLNWLSHVREVHVSQAFPRETRVRFISHTTHQITLVSSLLILRLLLDTANEINCEYFQTTLPSVYKQHL